MNSRGLHGADPAQMTDAGQLRRALARVLAERCPPELAREIAVTGSVARGVADCYSDLEMNMWVDALPAIETQHAWLSEAGATDLNGDADDLDVAGFRWMVCSFEGVWVEIGWAAIQQFDDFVRDLAVGVFIGHERLQMGWTVEQAVPLRTEGRLADWKAALSRYPDGLAERVIADQTSVWSDPHVPGVRWGLAARGERMGLALRFTWDMQNLMRVLFAVNHVWDRDLKWTDARSLDLPIKPSELSTRIDAMFHLTDLPASVEINQRLIVDTLELAQERGFDVADALRSMRDGLREGLEGVSRG